MVMDNNTDNSQDNDINLLQSNAFARAVASRESVVTQDSFSSRKKREASRRIVSGYQFSNMGSSRSAVSPTSYPGATQPSAKSSGGVSQPPAGPRPL